MTISLSGNPIVKHEARSQWRRGRAYWLLLVYAILLAGLTVHSYPQSAGIAVQDTVINGYYASSGNNLDVIGAMSQNGREIFRALATLQAALWLLITPALTATSIASEREAGLLEALQLSRLRAGQIVGGKFIACLWLVLLMILAALPPLSICFLLGGVAPAEFVRAAIVQLGAAICGASIGLFFSARSPRPSWAMSQTFVVIALWSIAAYDSFSSLSRWMVVNPFWDTVHELITVTHPVSLLQIVLGVTQPRSATTLLPDQAFALFIGLQIVLCFLLLRAATRATGRALPATMWIDRDRWTDRLRARWQAERERREELGQRLAAARLNNETDTSMADDAQARLDNAKMVLLAEFPIEPFVRFSNPVLRREVRHKFRWRKATLWVAIGRSVAFLAAACVYLFGLFLAFDGDPRNSWWMIASLMLLAQTPALAFMAATSFSREREAGTWEGLNLSALRPTEVLWGKLAAPLVTLFYYSVPFWPIMIVPFIRSLFGYWDAAAGGLTGAQPVALLTSLAIVAGSAFATTAMALLLSWLCRKTVTAVSWTIASLFAFHFGLPIVMTWMNDSYQQAQDATALFHPWQALQNMASRAMQTYNPSPFDPYATNSPLSPILLGWMNALLHFSLAAVMLSVLLFAMRRSIRERDRSHGNTLKSQPMRRTTAQIVTIAD